MANEKYPIAKADLSTAKAKPKGRTKRKVMVCPECKKDFAEGIKAAYKLGLLDGGNRLQTTINCIQKTNKHLFDELLRLDRASPLDGCCIKISRVLAEKIVKTFKTCGRFDRANEIQTLINSQIIPPEILEETEEK